MLDYSTTLFLNFT